MRFITRDVRYLLPERRPPCGTICCISGWASVLSRPKIQLVVNDTFLWTPEGRQLDTEDGRHRLGLTPGQSDRLFFVQNWPALYRNAHEAARTHRQEAAVTLKRIDHFIRSKGRA
jgi:hypothetical protein